MICTYIERFNKKKEKKERLLWAAEREKMTTLQNQCKLNLTNHFYQLSS